MPQSTWQGQSVPAGTDPWSLVPNLKTMLEQTYQIIPVASAAARDALTPPSGKYAGLSVVRTDLPGLPIERWNGTAWRSYASGNLALGGLYQGFGAGYRTPGYRREPEGNTVHLYGLIGVTTDTITMLPNTQYLLGTIPADIAPQYDELFTPSTSTQMGGKGTIYIRSNGNIHYENSVSFSSIAKATFFIGIGGCKWEARP